MSRPHATAQGPPRLISTPRRRACRGASRCARAPPRAARPGACPRGHAVLAPPPIDPSLLLPRPRRGRPARAPPAASRRLTDPRPPAVAAVNEQPPCRRRRSMRRCRVRGCSGRSPAARWLRCHLRPPAPIPAAGRRTRGSRRPARARPAHKHAVAHAPDRSSHPHPPPPSAELKAAFFEFASFGTGGVRALAGPLAHARQTPVGPPASPRAPTAIEPSAGRASLPPPETLKPQTLPLNPKPQTPQRQSEMEGKAFIKLAKDCKLLGKAVTTTDADLIFAKARAAWRGEAGGSQAHWTLPNPVGRAHPRALPSTEMRAQARTLTRSPQGLARPCFPPLPKHPSQTPHVPRSRNPMDAPPNPSRTPPNNPRPTPSKHPSQPPPTYPAQPRPKMRLPTTPPAQPPRSRPRGPARSRLTSSSWRSTRWPPRRRGV
jgi:hypothetical protein